MSAKRPRPAIPVLVHVDNPTDAASVTVDTSTIEGKMDTVINNQERIYDKIPTSTGGGSADLTTVNQKITTLAAAVGLANSGTGDRNLIGHVINLVGSIGDFNSAVTPSGGTVKSYLSNIRNAIGNSINEPTATETTVRGLLTAIKENTASGGGGGSADLTTVNEKTTSIAAAIGTTDSVSNSYDLLGRIKNLVSAVGDANITPVLNGTTTRSYLYNIREAIGDSNVGVNAKSNTVRSFLYNIRDSIGHSLNSPTATGTTVRDLLTAIKENTASGGSGGSADLTTVNEKTTALAAAIGSASDDASTVSVIGLLKSITDKY